MTTNKKDKTEDILEKVKDVLEKKDEKREGARWAHPLFLRVLALESKYQLHFSK